MSMRKRIVIPVLGLTMAFSGASLWWWGCGTEPDVAPVAVPEGWRAPPEGLHAAFDGLLAKHVSDDATVDYAGLKADEAVLDRYLEGLNFTRPGALTQQERLAYWINAYNAFTLKLILDHYPGIKSIKDLTRPWKSKVWAAGGSWHSLDGIEHEILRVEFDEPRIHFAINCASKGCPALRAEAFLASKLEAQLADQTRRFLADTGRGMEIEARDGKTTLVISKIFKWFSEDFERSGGSVQGFIRTHAPEDLRQKLSKAGPDLPMSFLEYDWSLNGK